MMMSLWSEVKLWLVMMKQWHCDDVRSELWKIKGPMNHNRGLLSLYFCTIWAYGARCLHHCWKWIRGSDWVFLSLFIFLYSTSLCNIISTFEEFLNEPLRLGCKFTIIGSTTMVRGIVGDGGRPDVSERLSVCWGEGYYNVYQRIACSDCRSYLLG